MPTSRRKVLGLSMTAAGAGAAQAIVPAMTLAQDNDQRATQRLAADLQTHASFGLKFSGGAGDKATAEWTAERLRRIGYRVEKSEFDVPFFVERTSEIRIGGAAVDVYPQAPVAVTGRAGVRGRLTVIEEDATGGNVNGRVAVIVAPFGRHAALFPGRGLGQTVIRAAEGGAVAIVIVTTGPSGEAVALNCPEDRPFVPVPLAVLAPKLSGPVIEAARAGTEAILVIDGEATHRPCQNVLARLERGPQWIAMSTPRSGWFHCVAERGTGQAAFFEIAAWLERTFPMHSVFLMNTGGHEYFFAGSHRVLDQTPPPGDTLVWAHIGATLAARDAVATDAGDWVMLDTVDPFRRTMATQKARDAVAVSFAGLTGLDEPGLVQAQAGELSTFTGLGFDTAFACLGQHRWFHTVADTIECVDARLLLPVVRAHQATIERLVRV
jgi:hypothetical protein